MYPCTWVPHYKSDRRPLYLFDDENRAKVRRPIGTIDHDGWTYVTYGPLDDWGAHPVQNPNDIWANFNQAANNFVQAVNNFVQAANAPTLVPGWYFEKEYRNSENDLGSAVPAVPDFACE